MTDELHEQDQPQMPPDSWEAKAQEYLAGWRRAQADYVNLQKEVAQQRSEMGKHASAEVVRGFLPVYDYFKRAMQHVPPESEQSPSVKNWMLGTQQIAHLFKMTLTALGVQEIDVMGKTFDPHTMEAVKEEHREGAAPGTVLTEVEGGYRMGEKILKPARVIVAAEPQTPNEQTT